MTFFNKNIYLKKIYLCLQALEDVHLQHRPILQDILYYMDRIFTVIFFIEMLIKFLALGFAKYFTNAWCWLDFVIVMVSSRILVPTPISSFPPEQSAQRSQQRNLSSVTP